MAIYAYIRVSTEDQSFDRQLCQLNEYFTRYGIDASKVQFVEEKITSYTSFRQRSIYPILKNAKEGDVIYACQVDRFGRTVDDLIQLVDYADARGVVLQAIKDSLRVTRKTTIGKLVLTMMATAAEMERDNLAERRKYGIEAAKEEIKKNGYRIARSSGKVQTRWGNEKGVDMRPAYTAAGIAHTDRKIAWRESSPAFKWVMDKIRAGVSRNEIIEEFNRLHELQPDVFCTPQGKPLTKGILSYWIKDAGI